MAYATARMNDDRVRWIAVLVPIAHGGPAAQAHACMQPHLSSRDSSGAGVTRARIVVVRRKPLCAVQVLDQPRHRHSSPSTEKVVPMKPIHIIAGLIALIAGAIALYSTKGSNLHRRSGIVFAIAMLIMTSSAVVMAAFINPNRGNVVAGLTTFYLIATAWLAVRRPVAAVRGWMQGLMLMAVVVGAYACALGFEAMQQPNGIGGIPAPPLFMFAVVGLAAAAGDARVLRAGRIEGKARIARHLWRMSFALWVAVMSFFLGQPKFFPEPLRHNMSLRAIPVVLVLVTMIYWVIRVRLRRPVSPMHQDRSVGASTNEAA